MVGILMVDLMFFDGDYIGIVVKFNIIDVVLCIICVGIGIGVIVWLDDIEIIFIGGSVVGNGLKGRYMGYGIVVVGLK